MRKVNFKVLNSQWQVIVRSDKVHDKKFANCHAIAILEDKTIHIRKSSVNEITLKHEIVHSYAHEMSFVEMQLEDDQLEEGFCELFAKYGEIIIKDAREICLKLS